MPRNDPMDHYEIIETIGKLKFPHIATHIVKQSDSNQYSIIKIFSLEQLQHDLYSNDKTIQQQIHYHPNLLTIEKTWIHKDGLYICEQYCESGDLGYFLTRNIKKNKPPLTEQVVAKWLLQILLALECLHFNKICHCEIKPENIYLTSLGNLKLNDMYLVNHAFQKYKKEKGSVLMEGYEQMVSGKRFKKAEIKDIKDFGLLIYCLCGTAKKSKSKTEISKGIQRLPELYSKQLNQIYLSCIKNKKKNITVKEILKTSYFLQTMRQFIISKNLNVPLIDRVPIKKYFIHLSNRNSQELVDINSKNRSTKVKDKAQESKQPKTSKLPSINKKVSVVKEESTVKVSPVGSSKSHRNSTNKRLTEQGSVNAAKEQKRQNSKEKRTRKSSAEMRKKSQEKNRQTPKAAQKKAPNSNKNKQFQLFAPPSLPKPRKKSEKILEQSEDVSPKKYRNRNDSSERQRRNMSHSESESPNKQRVQFKLTPEITFGKKVEDHYDLQKPQKAKSCRDKSQENSLMLKSEQKSEVDSEISKVSQNLAKIFSELQIRQDDDEEIDFEMDEAEQNEFRLTFKDQKTQDQTGDQLMKTYKSKLTQIVGELKGKYHPELEPIIQKTTQWDSTNEILINQQLLRKLTEKSLVMGSIHQENQNRYDQEVQDSENDAMTQSK